MAIFRYCPAFRQRGGDDDAGRRAFNSGTADDAMMIICFPSGQSQIPFRHVMDELKKLDMKRFARRRQRKNDDDDRSRQNRGPS